MPSANIRSYAVPARSPWLDPAQHNRFIREYRSVLSKARSVFGPRRGKNVDHADPNKINLGKTTASYLYHLGYNDASQRPIIFAGLSVGMNKNQFNRFLTGLAITEEEREAVRSIRGKYEDIVGDRHVDMNVSMATATEDLNAIRASLIRAVELLHTLRFLPSDYLGLARDLYMPLFYETLHHQKLAEDLGDEFVKLTDPDVHERIKAVRERHSAFMERHMPEITRLFSSVLPESSFTLEARPSKNTFSLRRKLRKTNPATGRPYAVEEIPDISAVRVILKHGENESEPQLVAKTNALARRIMREIRNEHVRREKGIMRGVRRMVPQKINIDNYSREPAASGYRGVNIPYTFIPRDEPDRPLRLELQLTPERWHRENQYGGPYHIGYHVRHLDEKIKQKMNALKEKYDSTGSLDSLFEQ